MRRWLTVRPCPLRRVHTREAEDNTLVPGNVVLQIDVESSWEESEVDRTPPPLIPLVLTLHCGLYVECVHVSASLGKVLFRQS